MPPTALRDPSASRSRRRLVATLTSLVVALVGGAAAVTTITAPVQASDHGGTPLPHHVLDIGQVRPGVVSCFNVADERGVPAGVSGVVVNVTAVQPNGPGYIVVFPQPSDPAAPMPATSTVNFEPGEDVASTTFVRLPPNGNLCHLSAGGTLQRLMVDLIRYVGVDSGIELSDPARLLDTRPLGRGEIRGPVLPRTVRTVQVAGQAGVPADAEAVILNVTVAGVTDVGNLRVFPGRQEPPNTSVLNYVPFVDKANATVVPLADDGTISFWSDTARPVEVILDVLGHVEPQSEYNAVQPTRLLDTRGNSRIGELSGPLGGHAVHTANLRGGVVPEGATAVVLNMTAIDPSTPGNLRAYADTAGDGSTPRPEVSMINYVRERAIPNLVVVDLPSSGRVNLWSDQDGGNVHVAVDVVGYLAP